MLRETRLGRVTREVNGFFTKPLPGVSEIQDAMREHNVTTSKDLPRAVRSGLAAQLLGGYALDTQRFYDGGDNMAVWDTITKYLGMDSLINSLRYSNLIDLNFLGITEKDAAEIADNIMERVRCWEEIALKEGWKQDEPKEVKKQEPHYLSSPDIPAHLLPPVPHGGLKVNIKYGNISGPEGIEMETVQMDCPYRCGFVITHADPLQDIAFVGAELLVRSHVKYHCTRAPQDIKEKITAARR